MNINKKEVLVAARALISDPAHWTQGVLARDQSGLVVYASDDTAVCFCAAGATMREQARLYGVNADTEFAVWDYLDQVAHELYGPDTVGIAYVNDKFGHEAVLKVFDKAIEGCGDE